MVLSVVSVVGAFLLVTYLGFLYGRTSMMDEINTFEGGVEELKAWISEMEYSETFDLMSYMSDAFPEHFMSIAQNKGYKIFNTEQKPN